ncbi:hypothetical protein OSB04_021576 [Centaurea solstitialis]|uniref:Uncharacterized protein n=1 Tax=Centaurea solstitialis TaxID=347529 RepID=A0AA38T257_9ASTR|nr:hypothetical protein OSB04_021576 [Centaurea solstitialis]
MTATHHRGIEWGKKDDENCIDETQPIMKDGFWESGSNLKMLRMLESSLNKLKARGDQDQETNESVLQSTDPVH